MKVYAEYFELPNEEKYRRKTLIHIGEGIELIGSAVLINPGSAKPIYNSNLKTIEKFYSKTHSKYELNNSDWHEFSIDPTMHQLVKIFNGWYLNKETKLEGVIQLFNCFYYKNANLDNAIATFNSDSEYIFNEASFFKDKPVYFGWGNTGKSKALCKITTNIFSNYDINKTPIYDSNFYNNPFYHPGYVNRSYKTNSKTHKLMADFNSLLNIKS